MPEKSYLSITISSSAKARLIQNWGPELVLRCSCGDRPSHSMWGLRGRSKCPTCNEICENIQHEWGVVSDGP